MEIWVDCYQTWRFGKRSKDTKPNRARNICTLEGEYKMRKCGEESELVAILWVEADVVGWGKSDFSSQNFCWNRLFYCIRIRVWCSGWEIGTVDEKKKSNEWNRVRRYAIEMEKKLKKITNPTTNNKTPNCHKWVTAWIILIRWAVREGWGLPMVIFIAFAERHKLLM